MEWIFVLLAVLIVFVGAIVQIKSNSIGSSSYRKKEALFSTAELRFLASLDEAVSDRYRVFGKVRVADVISPAKGTNRSDWQVAFNRISAKHFDYILCSKDDLGVVAAVELDDKSHSQRRSEVDKISC